MGARSSIASNNFSMYDSGSSMLRRADRSADHRSASMFSWFGSDAPRRNGIRSPIAPVSLRSGDMPSRALLGSQSAQGAERNKEPVEPEPAYRCERVAQEVSPRACFRRSRLFLRNVHCRRVGLSEQLVSTVRVCSGIAQDKPRWFSPNTIEPFET